QTAEAADGVVVLAILERVEGGQIRTFFFGRGTGTRRDRDRRRNAVIAGLRTRQRAGRRGRRGHRAAGFDTGTGRRQRREAATAADRRRRTAFEALHAAIEIHVLVAAALLHLVEFVA